MNLMLWVAGAMLAAVGLVQIVAWIVCRPQGPDQIETVYKVVLLRHDFAALEDQLRYELLLIHWNAPPRPELLVLVDDGLGDAERDLCRRMLCDFQTALLCAPDELADLLRLKQRTYPGGDGAS